ncbi:hypothetical protein CBR_g28556 [Chara braunii]|uniref:Post-GPI attachment to proteins factor 3 n=1 Tax=Chara braunii TaxID=69332 RepID=A0A388JWB3_CHABU|nr:hypothetical protein CBR_g28556 [Chara braunii]|eukprot:GBG62080.1 hypothetical protein CBR_g28556 [Chara braunii]
MGGGVVVLGVMLCLSCLQLSAASSGDRRLDFRQCVENCEVTGCAVLWPPVEGGRHCIKGCVAEDGENSGTAGTKNGSSAKWRGPTEPWYLPLTQWDCLSECKYQCMVRVETRKKNEAQSHPPYRAEQYFGKWPFVRVLGIEEVASVVFSIFNLLAHAYGLWSFSKLAATLPRSSSPGSPSLYGFIGLWKLFGVISINSWVWSIVFHSRSTTFTERLDYVSAIISVGYNFLIALIRTLNFKQEALRAMISAPVIGFTSTHVLYMLFYDFDYGLNMKVCLVLAILQTTFWPIWAIAVKHPAMGKIFFVDFGMLAALGLEVFDFPPLFGLFDSHSLWHLATVPLVSCWWSFVQDDARWTSKVAALNDAKKPL